MGVMRHRRSPCMEHGSDADPSTEVLGIGGDHHHRLRRCLEQQVVDDRLVLPGDVGDLGGQREDDMEVADRQQVGLTLSEPCASRSALALRTMPVATANGRCPLHALWANFVMGSWRAPPSQSKIVFANSTHHYEAPLSRAINLSGGRKTPFRRCGGTMDSIASSFSVGSPRV